MNESVFWRQDKREGRMGNNPEARVTTGRWIGYARRSQRTSEPGDEMFSLSHLLQGRAGERKLYVILGLLVLVNSYCDPPLL